MEITKTRKSEPPKILLHADHGLGKSSLAAAAPDPLFVNIEDGLSEIDADALPRVESWTQMMEQLRWVYANAKHKTLVVDSIDWAENLAHEEICKKSNKKSISDFDFGAGYTQGTEMFREFIKALDAIHAKKNMTIILIAHSQVREFKNPLGENFDRFEIELREKNTALFAEWCKMIGFIHIPATIMKKKTGFSTDKQVIDGCRVLSCYTSSSFQGKNRYGINEDIELPSPKEGWQNIMKAIKGDTNGR